MMKFEEEKKPELKIKWGENIEERVNRTYIKYTINIDRSQVN